VHEQPEVAAESLDHHERNLGPSDTSRGHYLISPRRRSAPNIEALKAEAEKDLQAPIPDWSDAFDE
jgi:hypothetical protein